MIKCDAVSEFEGGKAYCLLPEGHKEDHKFFESFKQYTKKEIEKEIQERSLSLRQTQFLREFQEICAEMIELTRKKNSDYAEDHNAFANFQTIEQITGGRVSVETGIVVRLTDKLKRIGSLLSRPAQVHDEKIEDTVFDMAVYSIILLIYMRWKNAQNADQSSPEKSNSR